MTPPAVLSIVERLPLTFRSEGNPLPLRARLYVTAVVATGLMLLVQFTPREFPERPVLVFSLLAGAMLLSAFKLRLPLGKGSSTMSMAHAVDFAALVTVGSNAAMIISAAGVLVQCTVRVHKKQPVYRAAFSVSSIVIAVQAAGWAWRALGGDANAETISSFVVPLSGMAITYFAVNTILVAGAIALSTAVSAARAWYREFFWSAPAYFLSAAVAGMMALMVQHESYVLLPLVASPLYISYRAYRISVERIEEERQHARALAEMIRTTQAALARATQSESDLAGEKERLALESTRLAVTLRTINDGVVSVDRGGNVLLLNEGARRLASVPQGQKSPRKLDDILEALGIAADLSQQALHRVLDDGMPVTLRNDVAVTDAGPGARLVEVTGTPTRDVEGHVTGAVWVLRDISDVARIEHERAKTARLESLGVLAGGLAHDFNNILMGIVGNLSLAQGMVRPEDAALTSRLTSAAAACARARGVTSQLLTFSKGGTPVKTTASILELVTECAKFSLSGSPVAPKFNVMPELWSADVDTVQIGQVVQNLVINAMQSMMPRGGVVEIALQNLELDADSLPARTALSPGHYVCLTVQDSGQGIAPDHLGRIFDPYFTTKEKGSGLGLAISYSIVRAHGGAITVESEVGVGTRFHVYLPATNRMVVEKTVARPQTARGRFGRVLLMDDEPMAAEVAKEMLETLGYVAEVAASGSEAVDKFREAELRGEPFDVAILDLTVPGGMGGREALPLIKEIRADVPVLVTSGYADDSVLANYQEYGFDGVLPKPFAIPELRRALEEADGSHSVKAAAAPVLEPGAIGGGRRRAAITH